MVVVVADITQYFGLDRFPATSITNEIRAGVSTFLTMSYILLVNPQILSAVGIPPGDVVMGTAVGSAIGSLLCGLFGNLPFGLAPGMGLSAYLAFGLVKGSGGLSWPEAFSCCFYAGSLMLVSALTGFSTLMVKWIPKSVKLATVVGMGLLIALIGMKQIHLVIPKHDTLVSLGDLTDSAIWLALAGVIFTGTLLYYQVQGSILIGIIVLSVISWTISGDWPTEFLAVPQVKYGFGHTVEFAELDGRIIAATLGFLFVGIFDVSGVLFGLSRLAGLEDENHNIPGDFWAYLGSAVGTMVAALMGCSPIIIHVESAAGIKEGGRTGLTSITIAVLFLASIPLAPLLEKVPAVATSPVLIIVGAMMIGESAHIDWKEMDNAIPAFLTIIMMPFTFSIADGVAFGIGSALLLGITTGKILVCCVSSGTDEERGLLLPHNRRSSFMSEEPVLRTPSLIVLKEDLNS